MRLIKPILAGLAIAICGASALALESGSSLVGGLAPKPGGKGDGGTASAPVYSCVVSDWSRPLKSLAPNGLRPRTPPPGSRWVCDLPRKSGGYGPSDVGATCSCDAYSARWAGKVED